MENDRRKVFTNERNKKEEVKSTLWQNESDLFPKQLLNKQDRKKGQCHSK